MSSLRDTFELIPAIDLLGGEAVRLSQGRYDEATVYDTCPERVAARFGEAGIQRLHVVDLEGAKAGKPVQGDAVKRILEAVAPVPVQLGGGLRSLEGIDEALGWGLDRVILGTVALRDPSLVKEAAARHPERIVVGIDARDGRVAVEGWTDASETTAVFRFVDDVTIRVSPSADGALIDVRSKSRDGRGDLGANAARIRRFAAEARLPSVGSR